MKLKLIKEENCPDCGSRIVSESCLHVHCNGEGFEVRQFECGCVLTWIPNSSRLETRTTCPKAQKEIEKKDKRRVALRKAIDYIGTLDTDEEFKERLLENIKYFL